MRVASVSEDSSRRSPKKRFSDTSPRAFVYESEMTSLVQDGEMGQPTDAELMRRIEDSEEAFAILVHRHQKTLLNLFYWLGADIYEAEDLIQETFLKLFKYRHRYTPSASLKTFLCTLAYRTWVDARRKRRKYTNAIERTVTEHPLSPPPSNEAEDVRDALAQLSNKLRSVLVLNIYQSMRYHEIAEVLDIPIGTVKSRIHLAIKQMRELLSVETVPTEQKE